MQQLAEQQIAPCESLRRARITLDVAERELRSAQWAARQIEAGRNVVAPNLAAAEAEYAKAKAAVDEIAAELDAMRAAEQVEVEAEAARLAEQRRLAIAGADSALLAARRACDRAHLDRLAAARDADDAEYRAAVERHLNAHVVAAGALAARDALGDHE